MNKNTKTIAQMAASLAGNPKVEQEVQEEIARSSLVSHLLSMRVLRGVTQEHVASVVGCNPSKISRMESGNDDSLRWNDVISYTSALNVRMCLLFEDPQMPAAERIKHCVFSIREHLDNLTKLAADVGCHDEIAKKINEFSGEVLFNFLMHYKDRRDSLQTVLKITPTASQAGLPSAMASEMVNEESSEEVTA